MYKVQHVIVTVFYISFQVIFGWQIENPKLSLLKYTIHQSATIFSWKTNSRLEMSEKCKKIEFSIDFHRFWATEYHWSVWNCTNHNPIEHVEEETHGFQSILTENLTHSFNTSTVRKFSRSFSGKNCSFFLVTEHELNFVFLAGYKWIVRT